MIRRGLLRRLRAVEGTVLCIALLSQSLLLGAVSPVAAQKRILPVESRNTRSQDLKGTQRVQSERVSASTVSVVNFKTLAAAEKQKAIGARRPAKVIHRAMPAPQTIQEVESQLAMPPKPLPPSNEQVGPLAASPAPSKSFLAHSDGPKIGTTTFVIPPDTTGAVGRDKIMTTLNNNWVVQDKTTGAELSGVSMETFWAGTTATGSFDPRVLYDPYNDRWIVSGVSNAQTAGSSILIGISDTSDPEGTFTLFRFEADDFTGGGNTIDNEWADFPMVGFNKNWVAVGVNMFNNTNNAFTNGRVLVIDYPTLRAGTLSAEYFFGISAADAGFCIFPATTFSNTENTLYAPAHQSSASAEYRLHTITGTPEAPVFTIGELQTRPGGGWSQPGGDILPQTCIGQVGADCPANPREIDSGDAFIRSNVVFRNGFIWYAQTIALPEGGLDNNSHIAAQWTRLDTSGAFSDGGRVEDANATLDNGGEHYAYPSISVNKHNDALLGFSNFESDDLVDAGYTFRLGTDAAGTMGDPVIFKEGEDYYAKTFGGTRNRWGDFSHTVVDPVNDRDLWTIQEYAQMRTAPSNQAVTNNSRWGTWWAMVSAPAAAGDLLISEFRNRGPNGAADEYIEIYNNSSSPFTVRTLDGSGGYSVVAEDNEIRCVIPNGTEIPGRGHFLCVNSQGYSLGAYPAGVDGTTATGDATFTADIDDNSGIALFRSATTFDLANLIDSVGFATTPDGLFKEGAGIPVLAPQDINYAFYRDNCGKGGSLTTIGPCPSGGLPVDTNDNGKDFLFVDTGGTLTAAGQRLGAPGPENLSSPIEHNSVFPFFLLDSTVGATLPPNRARDLTPDPANNSTFGTLEVRRRIVNNTGFPVTRLRFRIVDITTFPQLVPAEFADVRSRTSASLVVSNINDKSTCNLLPTPCQITVQGTTIETPPAQPGGGAFNSSLSADTITLDEPLAVGASINVRFLLGIQNPGRFRLFVNVEALTGEFRNPVATGGPEVSSLPNVPGTKPKKSPEQIPLRPNRRKLQQ
jgi:hypothetical protein